MRFRKKIIQDLNPLSCQANKIVAEIPDYETAVEIANKNHCRLQSYRGENWYAVPDVKKSADCVTLSNDEDGVAEWLEKNVLIAMAKPGIMEI